MNEPTYPVPRTAGLLAVRRFDTPLSKLVGLPSRRWLIIHVPTDLGITEHNTKREAVSAAQAMFAALPIADWQSTDVEGLNDRMKAVFGKARQ